MSESFEVDFDEDDFDESDFEWDDEDDGFVKGDVTETMDFPDTKDEGIGMLGFEKSDTVANGQGVSTYVDIVFCIDITGSMAPIIDSVKKSALSFHENLKIALGEKGRDVTELRIKVIGFRDIYVDSKPFEESEFFTLPSQSREYESFVKKLVATGGGDEPENGLEALVKAMKSDWTQQGVKKRHIIVMFTDASAHKLEMDTKGLVSGMPKNLDEAEILWNTSSQDVDMKLNQQAKRLLIFAPNSYPWSNIIEEWDLVWHEVCEGGEGLSELPMETIYKFLANSV